MRCIALILFFIFALPLMSQDEWEKFKWTGHVLRFSLGNIFDFELEKRKGDDLPTQALFKYGYSYGHQFDSGLYLGAGLDWMIMYPRSFNFKNKKLDFLKPPIAFWWVPLTEAQIGYAFNPHWLTTVALIYYWGLNFSGRYRPTERLFIEGTALVWLDRIFNTGGFYGGGLDNLHLTMGVGFLF